MSGSWLTKGAQTSSQQPHGFFDCWLCEGLDGAKTRVRAQHGRLPEVRIKAEKVSTFPAVFSGLRNFGTLEISRGEQANLTLLGMEELDPALELIAPQSADAATGYRSCRKILIAAVMRAQGALSQTSQFRNVFTSLAAAPVGK